MLIDIPKDITMLWCEQPTGATLIQHLLRDVDFAQLDRLTVTSDPLSAPRSDSCASTDIGYVCHSDLDVMPNGERRVHGVQVDPLDEQIFWRQTALCAP
ncbi:MAG: hypothetical protein H0U46_06895 [Actinobacteria bacterium]|nr:hypothetical protein [Actinomycetota bacterium]